MYVIMYIGVIEMLHTNATTLRKNLFGILE